MLSGEPMKETIDSLSKKGKMIFFAGATEKQIHEFELMHDIVLPSQYREWLKFSDGGDLFLPAGVQLYGVAHKPLINVMDGEGDIVGCIVIGALTTGDPIVCESNDETISIYNQEAEKIENDEQFANFLDFLNNLSGIVGEGD